MSSACFSEILQLFSLTDGQTLLFLIYRDNKGKIWKGKTLCSQFVGDWLEINYSYNSAFVWSVPSLKLIYTYTIYILFFFILFQWVLEPAVPKVLGSAGKLSHGSGSLSPSESQEILYLSNLLHSFGDFSQFFKNIWHCNCSSDPNEEMS